MKAVKKATVKRFYVHSEMIEAGQWIKTSREWDLDEITVGKYYEEGGCDWEFSIDLVLLGRNQATIKLSMFNDSFTAFTEAKEVFEILRDFHGASGKDDREDWPKLIARLEKAGWEHHKAIPKPKPVNCETCGHSL